MARGFMVYHLLDYDPLSYGDFSDLFLSYISASVQCRHHGYNVQDYRVEYYAPGKRTSKGKHLDTVYLFNQTGDTANHHPDTDIRFSYYPGFVYSFGINPRSYFFLPCNYLPCMG